MPLEFSWDSEKAVANLEKHRVSFEEASTAFGDPLSITVRDPDHSEEEARFVMVGQSFRGRLCATTAQRGDRDVEPVDSLQPCCTRDEGGPLEAGMQVQASNPLELRG